MKTLKIVVEKHPDGYVAYPLGLKGVVVGEGDTYDQALADEAQAVAMIAQARASVGAARVDLERTTIRAPIAGTVLQRSVDVGQTVAASLQAPVLFTIAQDLARMEVHAAIDEADVGKLREGQEATFTVDAYPGEAFRATIFQIRSQPNVQQNVVTYDAVVRFDNPDSKLRPGMTATVRVVSLRREDVLRVPNAALRFKPSAVCASSPAATMARTTESRRPPVNHGAGSHGMVRITVAPRIVTRSARTNGRAVPRWATVSPRSIRRNAHDRSACWRRLITGRSTVTSVSAYRWSKNWPML